MKLVEFTTSKGIMRAELFEDEAPLTVENFLRLVEEEYYDGCLIFKFIPDVLLQTGCPIGDGTGHPGYHVKCELNGKRQYHEAGILSMAHTHRDANGSQFIICLGDLYTNFLNYNHTCFGRITDKSREVLKRLRKGDSIETIRVEEVEEMPRGENIPTYLT